MKKLKVTVEGKIYHVTVEPLTEDIPMPTAPTTAPQVPAAPPTAEGETPVLSPLAGKVVAIDVNIDQAVNEGDQLMVLEAMKMNTYIYAPKSGGIRSILVSEGDTVEEGQNLIIMA
ncbi:MAG: Methylmalonyl-CoA carboxyltransferase 1.3S subunit [Verrucomicrobia subdivision 3 bacterium]|nr:Methylmalonyl-CoA carboxyltransferase 1.3S subunit [Limisphaerales bacterium]MCS1412433.1 Methylmalonyl-CoA carboxyltransferase 1.3S subunit [Limisphaerales bacterium]